MSLVRLENIYKSFAGESVLADVNLRIEEGDRIALIGRNGTGKTTLFRLITGATEPDQGRVERMRRARVVYLEQIPRAEPDATVMDIALSPFSELLQQEQTLKRLQTRMAAGDAEALAHYGEEEHDFQMKGGYEFRTRVKMILCGLGFLPDDFEQSFHTLSGGWRARLMLSLTLLQEADLLLLDEPENHLDMTAREWLEEHIQSRQEAVVLISHDRRMVNVIAKRIWEVERGILTSYTGNYDAWLKEKAVRREQQQKAYERQEAFIRKEQAWIDRFRYKNTKARQAQSRLKRLDKMELLEAPLSEAEAAGFELGEAIRSGETVLEARELAMAYEKNMLYQNLSFLLHRGERLGIIGPNGSGKTTLLRQLAGKHNGLGGTVRYGHNVKCAFYEQHQEQLNHDSDLLTEMQRFRPDWNTLQCRSYLGRFLFCGEDVFKPISIVSGGERSRLALAKLIASEANLLLLDEPTNHLDIASREALEASLDDYQGALIVVSHDRTLMDRLVERLLVIQDGHAQLFQGNFSDFRRRQQNQVALNADRDPPVDEEARNARLEARELKKAREREMRREQRRVEQLEADIAVLEKELATLASSFCSIDPTDYQHVRELNDQHKETQEKLESLYEQWAQLAE